MKKETGFISIFSVLIIMSILALVTLGFSAVVRNAQRRTLDNQLNTQAYYAAESGVNDAKVQLALNPTLTKKVCQGPLPGFNYVIDATLDVGYSCLLIYSEPPELRFPGIPPEGFGAPKTFNFTTSTGGAVRSFDVLWSADTSTTARPAAAGVSLPAAAGWGVNHVGMVRIDLVPSAAASLDRNSLATGSYTFFLYPSVGGSSSVTVASGFADQGSLHQVNCGGGSITAATPCVANVTLTASTSSQYTMRIQALYSPVNIVLNNGRDATNTAFNWQGAQIVIDATGRANDVYKRIQVRLPPTPNGLTPAFSIQSADSICKLLAAAPPPTNTSVDLRGSGDTACAL